MFHRTTPDSVRGTWTDTLVPSEGPDGRLRSAVTASFQKRASVGSVIKKRRKRMAKKKHRKLLKKTRVQRRRLGK